MDQIQRNPCQMLKTMNHRTVWGRWEVFTIYPAPPIATTYKFREIHFRMNNQLFKRHHFWQKFPCDGPNNCLKQRLEWTGGGVAETTPPLPPPTRWLLLRNQLCTWKSAYHGLLANRRRNVHRHHIIMAVREYWNTIGMPLLSGNCFYIDQSFNGPCCAPPPPPLPLLPREQSPCSIVVIHMGQGGRQAYNIITLGKFAMIFLLRQKRCLREEFYGTCCCLTLIGEILFTMLRSNGNCWGDFKKIFSRKWKESTN